MIKAIQEIWDKELTVDYLNKWIVLDQKCDFGED